MFALPLWISLFVDTLNDRTSCFSAEVCVFVCFCQFFFSLRCAVWPVHSMRYVYWEIHSMDFVMSWKITLLTVYCKECKVYHRFRYFVLNWAIFLVTSIQPKCCAGRYLLNLCTFMLLNREIWIIWIYMWIYGLLQIYEEDNIEVLVMLMKNFTDGIVLLFCNPPPFCTCSAK